MTQSRFLSFVIVSGALLWAAPMACAQDAAPAAPADAPMVRVDLPENLELRHMVDLVSERLAVNIVYDPVLVAGKTVTVRSPNDVTESSLMGLLDSALRLHNLAMVEMDQPGWRKIVAAMNLQTFAQAPATGEGAAMPLTPVIQVFTLQNADPNRVAELVRPLLTTPGGNVVALPGGRQIVVTDFGPIVERVGEVLRLVDVRDENARVEVVSLIWSGAEALQGTLQRLLDAEMQAGVTPSALVAADESSNQLVIVGRSGRVQELAATARELDKPNDLITRVYRFKAVSPEQVDRLFKQVMAPAVAAGSYRAAFDRGGALVVAAPEELHDQLASLVEQLDIPAPQSPIQFYKLKNTVAEDVLETIRGLSEDESSDITLSAVTDSSEAPQGAVPNTMGAGPDAANPVISAPLNATGSATIPPTMNGVPNAMIGRRLPPNVSEQTIEPVESEPSNFGGGDSRIRYTGESDRGRRDSASGPRAVRSRQAIVTADKNTNSIIVVAPPAVQATYAELIRQLDQRRPQVLIEVTMVTLDTSNGFSLGVEISDSSSVNDGTLLTFSAFGLSEVDAETGKLTPIPSIGGNVALLGPDIANVVLQALATNSNSKLISMPQLLVNDNEDGRLQSVLEIPFSQLNQLNTGGTTETVGGTAQAGTLIEVTPHISEGDYLQLAYAVELSSFTGQAQPNLPPPIQTNNVESAVTIPDGHTIVVGGLKLKNNTAVVRSVPILGQIPIIEYLFSSRDLSDSETTLFVFIKPVILRDDQFKDLKYYSGRKIQAGELDGDYPRSEPLLIR